MWIIAFAAFMFGVTLTVVVCNLVSIAKGPDLGLNARKIMAVRLGWLTFCLTAHAVVFTVCASSWWKWGQ